jgi:hypothetical protein
VTTNEGRLRIRDAAERVGFVLKSRLVTLDKSISADAKNLYDYLRGFAIVNDEVWPGQLRIGKELGICERTVKTYIAELKKRGLITVEAPTADRATNTYWFEPLSSLYSPDEVEWCARLRTSEEVSRMPISLFPKDRQDLAPPPGQELAPPRGQELAPPRGQDLAPKVDGDLKQNGDEKNEEGGKALRALAPPPSCTGTESEGGRVEGKVEGKVDVTVVSPGARGGSAEPAFTTPPPTPVKSTKPPLSDAEKRRRAAYWVPPDKDEVTISEEPESWPPRYGADVYALWLEEMQRKDPTFMDGQQAEAASKEAAIGKRLLKRFDPEKGDLLLKAIRVAVWDWPAIQASDSLAWYAKGRPFPTIESIVYLADTLAGAAAKGIIALPNYRESAYFKRFVAPPPIKADPTTDPIAARMKAEGKSRAQVVRELNEERANRRTDRATG